MRSKCIAAAPQSTCSYTWKSPATLQARPELVDQAYHTGPRTEARPNREMPRAEHCSIPWKTYLASREFKNLASDIADAVFSPSSTSLSSADTERPSSLYARPFAPAAGLPTVGTLLASVLPDACDAPRSKAEKQGPGLALAA